MKKAIGMIASLAAITEAVSHPMTVRRQIEVNGDFNACTASVKPNRRKHKPNTFKKRKPYKNSLRWVKNK